METCWKAGTPTPVLALRNYTLQAGSLTPAWQQPRGAPISPLVHRQGRAAGALWEGCWDTSSLLCCRPKIAHWITEKSSLIILKTKKALSVKRQSADPPEWHRYESLLTTGPHKNASAVMNALASNENTNYQQGNKIDMKKNETNFNTEKHHSQAVIPGQ